MADDVLKDTIEIAANGSTYEFAIPSYLDEIKVGVRTRDILRSIGGDSTDGLDNQTFFLVRTAAQFETLLRRSSVDWPWSPGTDGKPVVDFHKWPKDRVSEALAIGMMFGTELGRFRTGGVTDTDTTGSQALESQSNP